MGWWWGSPSSTTEQPKNETHSQSQQSASHDASTRTPNQQTGRPDALKSLDINESPDDAALEELKAVFANAEAETNPSSARQRKSAPIPQQPLDSEFYEDSIFPSKMKCHQSFDQAFFCSSIGGQATNIYRYGGLRSCSEAWREWRFCMRTKGMSAEEKKRRIREWNRDKHAKYKTGKSSEDVWEMRTGPIPENFLGNKSEHTDVRDMNLD